MAYFLSPSVLYYSQMPRLSKYVRYTPNRVRCPQLQFLGGHYLSRQVSKASNTISCTDRFWIEHYSFGRRGMEEISESCRTSILRSKPLAWLPSPPISKYVHQRNNKLVWDETTKIMIDLFDNIWGDKPEIVVDNCVDVTLPVRYLRIFHAYLTHVHTSTRLLFSSSVSQVIYVSC